MGKKRFLVLIIFAALVFTTMALKAQDLEIFEPFDVYTDSRER